MKERYMMKRGIHLFVSLLLGMSLAAQDELPEVLPRPDGKPADMTQPVQVYILMGQSNMLGFGKITGGDGSLTTACKEKDLYPYLIDDAGAWTTRKDVRFVRVMCSGAGPSKTYNNEWMSIKGNIGPEMGIGHYVGHVTDAPVMILKSCIGNRSLGWDLLPPGSPQYEYEGKIQAGYGEAAGGVPKSQAPGEWYAGVQYDGDIAAARKVLNDLSTHYPGATDYEVAGFFWWQGDKDFRNNAHSAKYEENLINLLASLRKDFDAPEAKLVCATLGQTKKGTAGNQGKILEAVLNVDGESGMYPENQGLVASVYSHPLSKGSSSSGHYGGNAETYMNIGQAMGQAMAKLLLQDPKHNQAKTVATPKPAAIPVSKSDPKSAYNGLEKQNLMLSPTMISRTLQAHALKPKDTLLPQEAFLLAYFSKEWHEVAVIMDAMPKAQATRVYDRILTSLSGRERPLLTPIDLLAIMRLSPNLIAGASIDRIATLIMATTLPEEEYMLAQSFENDDYIGGGDSAAKNLLLGRILMRTSFRKSALQFLPSVEEAKKLDDQKLMDEILAFHAESNALEEAKILDLSNTLNEKFEVLLTKSDDTRAKEAAMNELINYFYKVSPAIINTVTGEMLKNDRDLAARFQIKSLEKMSYTATRDRDGKNHRQNLDVLTDMAIILNKEVDSTQAPWKSIADMMADVWLQEVDYTLAQWPTHLQRKDAAGYVMPFATPNHLIAASPRGPWTENLAKDKMNRILLRLPKMTMISDDPDAAIGMIIRLSKSDSRAATVLAQEFVTRWSSIHNPDIPAHIIKAHGLPAGSSIVVTPIMINRNIKGFAKIMKLLRENGVAPTNFEELVASFGACYGKAEVYKLRDIEDVFGPINEMPDALFSAIINNMSVALGERWRDMATQRSAVTSRRQTDLLEMVREGYGYVLEMINARLAAKPKDWRALSACGTLMSDWGDYEYFQTLTMASDSDRMIAYKEKNNLAHGYFTRAAEAYVEDASNRNRVNNAVFLAWFDSLLGFNSNGEINLSKAMNREVLEQMRDIMRRLPGPKLRRHVDSFAKVTEARTKNKKNPMPAELKYKFLASSLVITKDSPFALESDKQVAYFQELLKEVRLQTTVDGPNTIWRKEDFGIIISLVHSDSMGDLIDFGKYLKFKAASGGRKKAPVAKIRKMSDTKQARNEFEKNILESLSNFFEVKSITFSPIDVESRTIDKPAWSETVLAYVQVRARGVSVDRIPPIELDLDYFDLSGPVAIPVTSAETLLQMEETRSTKRPYSDIKVQQTLDTRQLFVNGKLSLQITASGLGLMPDLEDIVNLAALKQTVAIEKIEDELGPQVQQLNPFDKEVTVSSSREWLVVLDSEKILDADSLVDVVYPTAVDTSTSVENKMYRDVELVAVAQPKVRLGKAAEGELDPSGAPIVAAPPQHGLWAGLAVGLVVVLVLIVLAVKRSPKERPIQASDVFDMPKEVDPFVVVRLLRSLSLSELVNFSAEQRAGLRQEIKRIESVCFDPSQTPLPESDLKSTASKWLKAAC
ncbi:MAG: hypothetical protein ACI8W8_000584 [Rhodothermales bacterium]|jgi:hypothetical protein